MSEKMCIRDSFYDAGAAIGNTPVDQLCNRFPFLFEEPELVGWPELDGRSV